MAMSLPHCAEPLLSDSGSHSRPPIHDSMICCQLSPVAHLVVTWHTYRQSLY